MGHISYGVDGRTGIYDFNKMRRSSVIQRTINR